MVTKVLGLVACSRRRAYRVTRQGLEMTAWSNTDSKSPQVVRELLPLPCGYDQVMVLDAAGPSIITDAGEFFVYDDAGHWARVGNLAATEK